MAAYTYVGNHFPETLVFNEDEFEFVSSSSSEFEDFLAGIGGTPSLGGISNLSDNGSGLIRVTTGGGVGSYLSGMRLGVGIAGAALVGQANAVGIWAITPISSTQFDLIGSSYNGADPYVSGGQFSVPTVSATLSLETAVLTAAQFLISLRA